MNLRLFKVYTILHLLYEHTSILSSYFVINNGKAFLLGIPDVLSFGL